MRALLDGPLFYVTGAWLAVTAALVALLIYRRALASEEEGRGQIYLEPIEEQAASEEQALGNRVLRLSKPIARLGLVWLLLLLAMAGLWLQTRWEVLGGEEFTRRLHSLFS